MLILSVMLSFLQVGSCADGDWGVQPKDPVDSGSPWTIAGKVDEPAVGSGSDAWTIQGKVDEESSSSGSSSSSSDSEDSDVPVAKKPPVKVDPESRRHEERTRSQRSTPRGVAQGIRRLRRDDPERAAGKRAGRQVGSRQRRSASLGYAAQV